MTVHTACCTLAGLYHVTCPAPMKYMPNKFIGETHPRNDLPRIQPRHVVHPADPDGSAMYRPCSLVDEQVGNVHGLNAPWVDSVRTRFTASLGISEDPIQARRAHSLQ